MDSNITWLLKILACGWACGLVSGEAPEISQISQGVTTGIGGEAQFECTISKRQEYPILWMRVGKKGDNFPIATGPTLLVKDERFGLDLNEKSGKYVLSIRDVRSSDSAVYQCQIVAGYNNMITADVELFVKLPPVISDNTTRTIQVVAGNSVEMECLADGFPTPRITWSKEDGRNMPNGEPSITTSRKLLISQTRREDTGNYICWANNGVGEGEHRTVSLEVEYAPLIEVPRPKNPQALNHDAELTCKIRAFPPPSIHWRQGPDLISNSLQYKISHFASQNDVTTSTVKIMGTQSEHYGNYTCEAANRHGNSSETIELYQSQIPICPPVCGDMDLLNGAAARVVSYLLLPVCALMYYLA
eukprot:maker-scaffold1064_size65302-snap-gene-0.24 protein:Tk06804 transcript:maker-scaffold1064_size65302-snap-gene-0.24-mRNA-1 annotation:"lach_scham ame: full"